jgi:hypothetical protein
MPATSSRLRPASERQRNFIRSLMAERSDESLAPLAAELQTFVVSGTIRSDLIDRLLAIPRRSNGATAGTTQQGIGEVVPAPSTGMRAGRMLLAGGIEATATLDDGRHVTVQIRTRKRSGRGWTNAALGEQDSRTSISVLGSKVGWLNVDADGRVLLTLRTRREEYLVAINALLNYAAGNPTGSVRVQEASRCGRCFLPLTDPVSIDRGIGPDCFGRDTGSQHVAAERRAAGQDVRPEPTTRPSLSTLAADAEGRAERGQSLEEWGGMVDEGRAAEDRMHAQFAAAEQAAERAAYEAEMEQDRQMQALETVADALTIPQATSRRVDSSATDAARARDLIAEALDAYFGEPETSFALGIFDQLAGR